MLKELVEGVLIPARKREAIAHLEGHRCPFFASRWSLDLHTRIRCYSHCAPSVHLVRAFTEALSLVRGCKRGSGY